MQVNYQTGVTGPLVNLDERPPPILGPHDVMVTGATEEAVRAAVKTISSAAKKKQRRMAAASRKANRK